MSVATIINLSDAKSRRTRNELIEIAVLNIEHIDRQVRQLKTQVRFNTANNIPMIYDFNEQIAVYKKVRIAKLINLSQLREK